jgi:hopanoid biosynthesis associated RND transporter like protein HpnN
MKEKILRNWARFATNRPWWVIAGLSVLVILSIFSASKLTLNMRYSDMLPMNDPTAQEFDRILNEYTSASTIIVVVQGEGRQIKKFADGIVPEIEKLDDYVEWVDYQLDKEFFANHGFMLSDAKDLERSKDMFKDLNLIPFLTHINDNFESEYIEEEEALSTREKEEGAVRFLDGLDFWIKTMDTYISESENATSELADSAVDYFLYGDPYAISQDKSVLLITAKPTFTAIDIDDCVRSTRIIREIISKKLQNFPGVRAALTGTIPVQADENEYVTRDMKRGFLIAMVLVLTLFILSFRMWSAPILAGFNLVLAIIITAGIISIYPGRLNPMTAMFAVILVGLGIDYSIHIISVYNERRAVDKDAPTAMEQTFLRSGSGIITGGLTTAVAFFALSVSSTLGIKEMGIVLGIGIISAMITTLLGLPALLVLQERFARKIRNKPIQPKVVEFKALGNFGSRIARRPLLFIIIGVLLTALLFYQTSRLKFDYNLLNVEPKGMTSVALYDTIIAAFDLSPDFAMVTTSTIEESWEIAEKAKEMPSVSIVDNIGDFVPPLEQQMKRRPHVEEIRRLLKSNNKVVAISKNDIDELIYQLKRLDMNIYELSQLAYIGGQDRVDLKSRSIIGDFDSEESINIILNLMEKIKQNPEKAINGLNLFQRKYLPVLRTKIYNMANPELLTLDKLPEHIKNRYLNNEGDKFLVTIFARGQIWNFDALKAFSKQMESISPKITGTPPVMIKFFNYVRSDGIRATLLTVIIVLFLLWIDFRSFRMALLGIIPLVIGVIWMAGLMKTFGLMLTILNVMGIPMIIGIGIDDGVHIIHRYRVEGFHNTPVVLKSTGKAILLTSLTTMVGFGSLMIATYRGFIGLGALLVLGVGACFITTVLFVPSIINLTLRRSKKKES